MKSIVLSGFMGTGKSTVGPLVASRLGLSFIDTDAALEARTGERIPNLWRSRGQAVFRELEAELVRELFADDARRVIAFGGGTVTVRALRHLALDHAFIVTLTARATTLRRRIADLDARPALAVANADAEIERLLDERAGAYAECHFALSTDDLSAATVADEIVVASRRTRIAVPLGLRTYGVEIVSGAPGVLRDSVAQLAPSSVIVVTDANVRGSRGAALAAATSGIPSVVEVVLPPGEQNKTLASVESIWGAAVNAGMDRRGVVVGFGGGVVGDLAGFAASSLLRGVRVVQAPTTLLAMVDASVGGKTGFDLPSGKNLIGSFHQPSSVVVDVTHLETLPKRDRLSGLAEVVKMALGFDAALWSYLDREAVAIVQGDPACLSHIIERAITLKAAIVRDDERESGRRALLNLGHTVGHALEAEGGYSRYRHGEAVALGMVEEARAGERMGLVDAGVAAALSGLLARLGLPTKLDSTELRAAWPRVGSDKKRGERGLALPLAPRIGASEVQTVTLEAMGRALRAAP